MRTVGLEIADDQAEALEREATRRGTSINELAGELFGQLAVPGEEADVMKDNIKSHDTEAPADLSQNADHYLCGTKKS